MRQLDLFGSILESPTEETKPAEQEYAAKNGQKAGALEPAFSKNRLSSERVGTVENAQQEIAVKTEREKKETGEVSTLFTSALKTEAEPTLVKDPVDYISITQEKESEKALPEITVTVVEHEVHKTEPKLPAVSPEASLLEMESDGSAVSDLEIAEPLIEVEKVFVKPKQKKPEAPELERNGAIIFDDGKITVKLKNKSPFPAPIVKVKKEKIKRLPQKRGRKSFKEIDAELDLIEIPEDDILFQKQYYPISEVAKWFRVNTSLLRFWENEFDVLKPRKNRKGDRLFRPEDVKNLQLIYQLLRQRKYTIEGAKEYIKTNKKKADIQLHLTYTLQKFKSFLLDMKANLQP